MNINNRSGLDILVQTWCENAETFQGFWPSRISTLALTQLFISGRPSLQNLMVKGDIIIKPETKNGERRIRQCAYPYTYSWASYHDSFENQKEYALIFSFTFPCL